MSGWSVIDHERGVLSYLYSFSEKGSVHTFAARLADGTMFVLSPGTNLTPEDYATLDTYGKVSAVATNTGFHHLGQFEPMDALQELLGGDVGLREAPSTRCGEAWAWARTTEGWAMYPGDMLCTWETFPRNYLLNGMWKLTRSGPGYRPFNLAMMAILKDKKACLRAFQADVEAHPPTTMVLATARS